jgi:class 3 adenylate cyclase
MAVQQAKWSWRFDASPEKIWPVLSDTERFNEAAAFPKHTVEASAQPDGSVIYTGRAKFGPLTVAWRDLPQEWVTNRTFRHERRFHNGPLLSMTATFRLMPDGAGSRGEFVLEAEPRNLLGRLMLATGFFSGAHKTFERLVADATAYVAGQREEPFEIPAPNLSSESVERLRAAAAELEKQGVTRSLVDKLVGFVAEGAEVDLLRIRPLRLARKWGETDRDVIELCLRAVRVGLLTLRWDLLCPNCRGSPAAVSALDQLPRGAHCPSCNIDYDRDFARNVELNFRPNPAIRAVADGQFCHLGPMMMPHVVAQQTLDAGETRELGGDLPPGDYRLRPLNGAGETVVSRTGDVFPEVLFDARGMHAGPPAPPHKLRFVNRLDRPATLLIESRDWVRDALTAHHATSLQVFRDLFSTDVLRPGDDAAIGQVTLMFTDLKGSTALYGRIGDAAAYRLVRDHFAFLAKTVREHDGAIVKTIGDAVMAAFSDPARALDAALAVQRDVMGFNREHAGGAEHLVIKLGLHSGACIAVNLNGRLDYFGTTVNMAARLQGQSRGGDIVLSTATAADPAAATRLQTLNAVSETAMLKGFDAPAAFLRLRPEAI